MSQPPFADPRRVHDPSRRVRRHPGPWGTFPAFCRLTVRSVAVEGEGEAAEARARLFDGSPARVVRLSAGEALDAKAYAGMTLAFVAGDDDAWALQAVEAARAAGVPVYA